MAPDTLKAAALTIAMVGLAIFNATSSSRHEAPRSPTPLAVVDIPAPKEGRLMHLRGLVGKGRLVVDMSGQPGVSGSRSCGEIRLRFVAGDFTGRDAHPPVRRIRLDIRNPDVLARLLDGVEVLSDEVSVSRNAADQHADIILQQGLLEETGFVLNPGEGAWAEVFGPKLRRVPCSLLHSRFGPAPTGPDL